MIAEVFCPTDNIVEQEANEHLIAAAPELLEAAKFVLRGFSDPTIEPNMCEKILKDAIAKAEGRE